MSLIIQKYGGSSLADTQKLINVARRVISARQQGNDVVVVLSAPGDLTDELMEKAYAITKTPDEREIDMLLATGEQISISLMSMAIKDMGCEAVSLTGYQVGIITDTAHTKARITKIDPRNVIKHLKENKIVIVAGFQGMTSEEHITTLGRGGSDLTAVALASVLNAEVCEIYTDVSGIYTGDPRIIPDARKLDRISYNEMLELASSGAQVMQARSIELAKKRNVKIHVRCSFTDEDGTIITQEVDNMEEVVVNGVTYDKNEAKISIKDLPDTPGIAAKVFGALAQENINVDMIIQSSGSDGLNDISFTVSRNELSKSLALMDRLCEELGAREVVSDRNIAKISIVGVGMRSHAGVAARMFVALAENDINIEMISTSEIKVSCVIKEKDVNKAVKAIHNIFNLGKNNE